MTSIYLSIGSNIEREKNIQSGLRILTEKFGALQRSSLYETAAVGFDGPPFFNLVVRFETDLSVHKVFDVLRAVEVQHGRTRSAQKFSGRCLDLDILLYGDLVMHAEKINIPRDDIMEYAFVLEPLAEIAADRSHPVSGETFGMLWKRFDKSRLEQKIITPRWFERS